jgi:hypothetical protein
MEEVLQLREQAEHWRKLAQKFAVSNVMLSTTFVSMALKLKTRALQIERHIRERPMARPTVTPR